MAQVGTGRRFRRSGVRRLAPMDMAPCVETLESVGSKRGQTYLSAGGDRLHKQLEMATDEGRLAPSHVSGGGGDQTFVLCEPNVRLEQ